MPNEKRLQMEEAIYVDMGTPGRPEEPHKFPSDENIYVEIKSREMPSHDTSSADEVENNSVQFRDQQRPSDPGKLEPPAVDLTCNCSFPCEGPCANGLVSKNVDLYESLLTDYQNKIQSSNMKENSIEPPPRKKKSMKKESTNESNGIHHSDQQRISLSENNQFVLHYSWSALNDSVVDSSATIDDGIASHFQSDGFSSLFTSTPVNDGINRVPRRNSSLPDLLVPDDIVATSDNLNYFAKCSHHNQFQFGGRDSDQEGSEIGAENQDFNDHQKSREENKTTPKRPSRKKGGILFVHPEISSHKHNKAHHAKFCFPAISNVKRQNELIKTSASIRASVNILDWSKRYTSVPQTLCKADSVAGLTAHEHANPSNLNVRRRLDKTKRIQTLRKRIHNALGLKKSDSSCWPKVFRRKKERKRMNSGRFRKRSAKRPSHCTESFATIFSTNEKKLSATLPDSWRHEVIAGDLFTTDIQESVEFPHHVAMPEAKGKGKRRTLRERLLSPKRLLSKDSTSSLDSVAIKKAISFLESSLHPSGSDNETNIKEKVTEMQSVNKPECDESAGASSETLDSITSARSASCVKRAMSHDGTEEEQDFFKKISLKTKFFLRTTSIPDMTPRILKAFSKNNLPSGSDDRKSNEVSDGQSKPAKFKKLLKRDTFANLGSLFSTEPITENDEDEAECETTPQERDTCTAEVHGAINVKPTSEVITTETQVGLENTTLDDESCFEPSVISNERKPSIVVTDVKLHDHLLTMDNVNDLNNLGCVLVEQTDLTYSEEKFDVDSTNSVCKTAEDSLLSPHIILDQSECPKTKNSDPNHGDTSESVDDSGNTSVKENVTSHVDLETNSVIDDTTSLREDLSNKNTEKLDTHERLEVTLEALTANESTEGSCQRQDNSEETVDDEYLNKSDIPSSSSLLINENRSLKQFAVSISPLRSESIESECSEEVIADHVLKTERCADTGRTVITYNAPVDGELVKIDLHEIDPNVIPLEKCADTGRTVIGCQAVINRLDSLDSVEDKMQEPLASNINSDPIVQSKSVPGNILEQCLHPSVEATSSDLNQLWDTLESSPCNDCESPSCGVPIVSMETDFQQEDTIVPEELHEEITSWKRNMCNERTFKTSARSNLLPLDDRRRIRANSILESDFEFEEEPDEEDCNNVRKAIIDGLRNKNQVQNSMSLDEKENSQNSSTGKTVQQDSSSDNMLNISMNDDFFDFFRDRAHEEHYAYILESDSENEEECAKAVVEYLANARRGSIETLLSQKNEESNHFQLQKVNVETGSLAFSNCSSRRSSKIELSEPTKDDIFDFFDGGGSCVSEKEKETRTGNTNDETKFNSDISKASDIEVASRSDSESNFKNVARHISNKGANDTMEVTDTHSISECDTEWNNLDLTDNASEMNECEKDIKVNCTIGEMKLKADILPTSDRKHILESATDSDLDNLASPVTGKNANNTIEISDARNILGITEFYHNKPDAKLNESEEKITANYTIGETKVKSYTLQTSDGKLGSKSDIEGEIRNLTNHKTFESSDAESNRGISKLIIDQSDITMTEMNTDFSNSDDRKNGNVSPPIDRKYDNVDDSVLIGREKSNDITEIRDQIHDPVTEDGCQNRGGISITFDEFICNGDKRETASCENIPDTCQIKSEINIDVGKSLNNLQSDGGKSNVVDLMGKNNSGEEQKKVKESNEDSLTHTEPNFNDNKREIVRKNNLFAKIDADIPSIVAPFKPPRLFTVRLIPEHAWRTQSSRNFNRNWDKSLLPETRDFHVTRSFGDIPAKLDSHSHSFIDTDITGKNSSDAVVSTDESFRNQVNPIPDGLLSAKFRDSPKKHNPRRGSFLEENDDFYDYFENPVCISDVNSRVRPVDRLHSNETSDVIGFSVLRNDMNSWNSDVNGDSVPMIETKMPSNEQCKTNSMNTKFTLPQLSMPRMQGDSETHNRETISVNSAKIRDVSLEKSQILLKDCNEVKQIELNPETLEHMVTQPVSQIESAYKKNIPCDNAVEVTTVNHHSTALLPNVSAGHQNRRHSFIDEKDDFFDYFDENNKESATDSNSSANIDNTRLRLVHECTNNSKLGTSGNVTHHSTQPLVDNYTENSNNLRGLLVEDSDTHLIIPVNSSANSDVIELEITKNDDSQTQSIMCKKSDEFTHVMNGEVICANDDTRDFVVQSTGNSYDIDINTAPFNSTSNDVSLGDSHSDVSNVLPHELNQLLSNNTEHGHLTEHSNDTAKDEMLAPPTVVDNEALVKDASSTEGPPTTQEDNAQSPLLEVIESDENEYNQSKDSNHIESIIKKDNPGSGQRRRSVTFSLPTLEISAPSSAEGVQKSSIMVAYSSNEDPFEYFGSCEPVPVVLKDDPFEYFTTTTPVSAARDIVDDSLINDVPNATEIPDQTESTNVEENYQHEPQLHNPHRRESHNIELLTITEANPDVLAIEEASYDTMEEKNNTSIDETDSQPLSTIAEPQEEILRHSDSIESSDVINDCSSLDPSVINLNELKPSEDSLGSTTDEQFCETENADAVSQQKPVILELVPKETTDFTKVQEEYVSTSDTELNKPSMSEFLIELPVAKVFEIIDAAEKSGSTSSLSKVAEEFVTNSPQYRTKFKHPNVSSGNKDERSSLPKAVSVSYETLLDTEDDSYNRITPFLPTYCHARKALFPSLSTSNLATLEKMDDNYSPRSLALGRPTIILQTWFDRQKQDHTFMKPARSSSDFVEMFSSLSVPHNTPSVCRSESLPPRKRMDTPSPGTPVDQFKEDNVELPPTRQEERVQQDRSLDVYPETLRQRQRHRNMAPSPSKVDIKNWNQNGTPTREPESPASGKKFLPSVKALRSQFETGKNLNSSNSNNGSVSPTSTFSMSSSSSNASTGSTQGCGNGTPTSVGGGGLRAVADPTSNLARKLSGSSLASSSLEKSSSNTSLNSAPSTENLLDGDPHDPDEPVEPIFCQFQKVDEELRELMSRPTSTSGWDPRSLLKRLYYVPEVPRIHSKGHSYVNIEGYLEKLPSGRKKATFWNAWKRRYFVAKDGVLYYYQNSQCDKQSLRLTLMGGKVETMEGNMVGVDDGVTTPADKAAMMLGIDDGKGHYVVVRCSSRSEAERWRRALESHLVEDFASQYVQPHPMPTNPSLLRDTLIIDIGSCSVRAGVLTSQATLPQLFFPSVVAIDRESRRQVWGQDALAPETRSSASISFPMKPSHRISKYSVDLTALSSLLAKTFMDLKVDPKNYNLQISVPRVLNQHTQSELLRTLFEKFGVKGVNVTHQSILALYAYNATSGIVVDIGERMEIVPVIDGYIVEGGVSRVPYGGCRILDHLRQFLYMRNVSLVNDVESYIIRHVLESACYSAQHYNTEKARCTNHPENFEKSVSLKEFFPSSAQCPYDAVELDFGRFQATEGIFNPDAWGLDHPGLHKLVHKAIQECSMDIRKEMSRSIFLAGGVTQLPGLADRLTTELDNLTPPAIRPKVHVSPYRYHAAYIGACTLAESPAFSQTLITRENWAKNGNAALRKWAL